MVKSLWQCDGNGLFFLSNAILIFLDTVTHVSIATDYLDITVVNYVFLCFVFFFTFLVGFHDFSRYFYGFSWFLVYVHSCSRYFDVFKFTMSTIRFFLLNHQD